MSQNICLKLLFFLAAILMIKCSGSNSPSNFMAFDKVRYVKEFPQTFSLNDGTDVNLDIIGIRDFCIYDSLLILSTTDKEGLWSFVSLPDYHFLGKFLTRGQGPFEFFQTPYVNHVKFLKENSNLYACIYHFDKGKLYKINITQTLKQGQLNISTLRDSLPPFIFDFVMIDSAKYFCKEINHEQTQQIRYISDNGKKSIPPYMEKLNSACIRKGEDFNIISTITKYNTAQDCIIEMPIGLNYINMYSIGGSFMKTICLGNKLDNIEKIQNMIPWSRIYTSADLRLFSKFWGVVYINEDKKTYQMKRMRLPEILLFDCNGEPLAKLKLNRFITSFDIDFANGFLYTLDVHSDEFYKYDVKDILKKIMK